MVKGKIGDRPMGIVKEDGKIKAIFHASAKNVKHYHGRSCSVQNND